MAPKGDLNLIGNYTASFVSFHFLRLARISVKHILQSPHEKLISPEPSNFLQTVLSVLKTNHITSRSKLKNDAFLKNAENEDINGYITLWYKNAHC